MDVKLWGDMNSRGHIENCCMALYQRRWEETVEIVPRYENTDLSIEGLLVGEKEREGVCIPV